MIIIIDEGSVKRISHYPKPIVNNLVSILYIHQIENVQDALIVILILVNIDIFSLGTEKVNYIL